MKEAHSKMPNNGESDVYGVQKGRVSFLCQDTSWSPTTKENWTGLSKSTEEWWKNWMSQLKEHDSTLFQTNGHALKQGLNVKQIKCVEAD